MKCYNGILHVRLRITSTYIIFPEFTSVTNKIPTNISGIIARDDNLVRVMLINVNNGIHAFLLFSFFPSALIGHHLFNESHSSPSMVRERKAPPAAASMCPLTWLLTHHRSYGA